MSAKANNSPLGEVKYALGSMGNVAWEKGNVAWELVDDFRIIANEK